MKRIMAMALVACAGCAGGGPSDEALGDAARLPSQASADSLTATSPGSVQDSCPGDAGPVRVTADSVGAIPLLATIRVIRDLCPAFVDTLYFAYEEMGRALLYTAPGLEVMAQQYLDSEDWEQPPMVQDSPPSAWRFSGDRVVIPGDIPLSATWGELVSRLTVLDISAETSRLVVRFEELPYWYFDLAEEPDVLDGLPREQWTAAIPGETRVDNVVVSVWLLPDQPAPAPD